jgi:hypothetical protein
MQLTCSDNGDDELVRAEKDQMQISGTLLIPVAITTCCCNSSGLRTAEQ